MTESVSLLKRTIKRSGMSHADFAREVFGVSRRTLTRMLAGERTLRPMEKTFLLDRLQRVSK
jgi:hypothetical protein